MSVFEMVAIIVVVGCLSSMFHTYFKEKNKGSPKELTELKNEVTQLKARIVTLETIVTDKSHTLKDQINRL